VVPGFPGNLMPRTHREMFTDEQIGDLIAAILWRGGGAGQGQSAAAPVAAPKTALDILRPGV